MVKCFKNEYIESTQRTIIIIIIVFNNYGFSVNETIGLSLVIQTFYPSALNILYNKDVYPTSSIV